MDRTIILLITFVISTTYLVAQDSMNYYPRMLQKELETAAGTNFTIEELSIPPDIAKQIYLGKYFSVHTNSQSTGRAYLFVGRVTTCRAGGCSINDNQLSAKESEFFDYYILYDSTCTIQKVKIFNYQATHGQEVTAKSWLRQFQGYRGESNLIVGKNVDAISGATISVEATAIDIEHKTSLLKLLLKKENS
ncbi:MAG: FMN-binding domain-containing protein [Bacteroidetes bacterium]|nr:MAG: FMN-binding domain-containing protein [Bacteroidota bacterium]